jgi:hypothetical protein
MRFMRTPIAHRCTVNDGRTVVRLLQTLHSASDADDNRTAA